MILLTILNSLAIIWIIFHKDFCVRKNESFGVHTFLGLWFYYKHRGFLYILFRNKRKVEVREDIESMLRGSDQSRRQTLNAKFSWLKTIEDVNQFVKEYGKVDKEFVDKLVTQFHVKYLNSYETPR